MNTNEQPKEVSIAQKLLKVIGLVLLWILNSCTYLPRIIFHDFIFALRCYIKAFPLLLIAVFAYVDAPGFAVMWALTYLLCPLYYYTMDDLKGFLHGGRKKNVVVVQRSESNGMTAVLYLIKLIILGSIGLIISIFTALRQGYYYTKNDLEELREAEPKRKKA